MYIKLKHSRAFCYKILNHLSCSHYLLPIYMQHLLRTDSWFFFLKKGWVDKWYFGADINLLEDRKRKKVLKISTGHKPLSYRNHKNRKSQKKKKVPKEMHRPSTMRGKAQKEPWTNRTSSLLQWWEVYFVFCHQLTVNEASEGHQVHN